MLVPSGTVTRSNPPIQVVISLSELWFSSDEDDRVNGSIEEGKSELSETEQITKMLGREFKVKIVVKCSVKKDRQKVSGVTDEESK